MAIIYDEQRGVFKLDTQNTSYVFCLRFGKYLSHLYYGARIDDTDVADFTIGQTYAFSPYIKETGEGFSLDTEMQEYSGFGSGDMRTEALRIKRGNGCRDTRLTYVSHEITDGRIPIEGMPCSREAEGMQTLVVNLIDAVAETEVRLIYSVYEQENVVSRHQIIINRGAGPIEIEKAASCCLDFYYESQSVISLPGGYGTEQRFQKTPIPESRLCFGSVAGTTSHKLNPFLAVASRCATEESGEVIGCNLVYSGNFLSEIERTHKGTVRLLSGINPTGFSWTLLPGESFYTPEALLTFSADGFTGMSHNFHRHIARHIVPQIDHGTRPVVLNTWEGFFFGVNHRLLLDCAEKAARLKIDTIVLDDGWFENRNDASAGLGDWEIDTQKFPALKDTVAKIHAMGLKFGIWIEPEMISENSRLFRAHPNWCLGSGREPSMQRSQLVLDMANGDVIDYLFDKIAALLAYVPISYVKWDMNRYLTEIGSGILPPNRQGEVAHRYVLGVYRLYGRLRAAFPSVFFENCSGGGGRFDLGMLFYSPQIWLSDNTSPYDRVEMQFAATLGYPPSVISSHVTEGLGGSTFQNSDWDFRYLTSSNFPLGYEFDVRKLSDDETSKIAEYNNRYAQLKTWIFEGDFYRLKSPFDGVRRLAVQQIVSKDKARTLVTILQLSGDYNRLWEIVRLRGLEKSYLYRDCQSGKEYRGSTLMNMGIFINHLRGNGACRQIEFEKVSAISQS